MTIKNKRHNETNTSHLTQLEEKSNTLFSANSFLAKELSKARQDKAPEKMFNHLEKLWKTVKQK